MQELDLLTVGQVFFPNDGGGTSSEAFFNDQARNLFLGLGLYLLARDPHKSVLVLAALGLCGFALVVALDAIRLTAGSPESLGRLEIFLVIEPGVAWLAVLLELARPSRRWRDRRGAWVSVAVVAAVAITGAALTEAAVIAHCRERLAGFKAPRQVQFVPALARNAAGKVDKTLLAREARTPPQPAPARAAA